MMERRPNYGKDKARPLGKYPSVHEAARKMGVTRQEAKRLLDPKPMDQRKHGWRQ